MRELRTVERALAGVRGVERAAVDLSARRARVEGDAEPEDLVRVVQSAGYEAQIIEGSDEPASARSRKRGCC